MPEAVIRWVDNAASTNSLLAAKAESAPHGTVVAAHNQTAGRGQRGNSWESAPGLNLTFSMLLRPTVITAQSQFELSMIVALAIRDGLAAITGLDDGFSVKWPNDIYFGNKKICGILIENTLTGRRIDRSIAGIGINVNQRRFVSDAPNPVSLVDVTGSETRLEPLLEDICRRIISRLHLYESSPRPDLLTEEYKSKLWRRHGLHYWVECDDGCIFRAEIADVGSDGILSLRDLDGRIRRFAFKEVAALI